MFPRKVGSQQALDPGACVIHGGCFHRSLIDCVPMRIMITGVTGMVGEGVMLECLEHPAVEKVLFGLVPVVELLL